MQYYWGWDSIVTPLWGIKTRNVMISEENDYLQQSY